MPQPPRTIPPPPQGATIIDLTDADADPNDPSLLSPPARTSPSHVTNAKNASNSAHVGLLDGTVSAATQQQTPSSARSTLPNGSPSTPIRQEILFPGPPTNYRPVTAPAQMSAQHIHGLGGLPAPFLAQQRNPLGGLPALQVVFNLPAFPKLLISQVLTYCALCWSYGDIAEFLRGRGFPVLEACTVEVIWHTYKRGAVMTRDGVVPRRPGHERGPL